MGRKIELYTDGAYSSSKGLGGWGCILVDPVLNYRKEFSGHQINTTNNQMELLAVIKGLEVLLGPCDVLVTSDSMYVVNAINNGWIDNWITKNWVTSSGTPVKNKSLWEQLHLLMQHHEVTAMWVKGHNSHPENERCDELAKTAIRIQSGDISGSVSGRVYDMKKLKRELYPARRKPKRFKY